SLQALANVDPAAQTRDRLHSIDRAFRILEGVHDLQELFDGLAYAASNERWQAVTPRARTVAPRDWAWLQMRVRQSPDDLAKLELREESIRGAIGGAQKILWESIKSGPFKEVSDEMDRRRRPEYQPSSRQVEVETVARDLRKAIELLRPLAENARQEIANLT